MSYLVIIYLVLSNHPHMGAVCDKNRKRKKQEVTMKKAHSIFSFYSIVQNRKREEN
jgi:hypothetical protein